MNDGSCTIGQATTTPKSPKPVLAQVLEHRGEKKKKIGREKKERMDAKGNESFQVVVKSFFLSFFLSLTKWESGRKRGVETEKQMRERLWKPTVNSRRESSAMK